MSSSRASSSLATSRGERRCTMICATSILLCYLFTCCTHLTIIATTTTTTQQLSQDTHQQQHLQLDAAALPSFGNGDQKLEVLSPAEGQHLGASVSSQGFSNQKGEEASADTKNNNEKQEEELKHDNVHKLMSEQDLRRTFQVDSHDQVPEYEILKLTVNDDGSHLISPISDLGELTRTTATLATRSGSSRAEIEATSAGERQTPVERHKRSPSISSPNYDHLEDDGAASDAFRQLDLERSLQMQSESAGARNRTRRKRGAMSAESAALQPEAQSESKGSSNYVTMGRSDTNQQQQQEEEAKLTKEHEPAADKLRENAEEQEDAELIVMKLSTFGKDFKLRLKRNVDFQQRIKGMKMFMAESTEDGRLRYTEIKNQPHSKQEPHKRAAAADQADLGDLPSPATTDSAPPTANIEPASPAAASTTANNNSNNKQLKPTGATSTGDQASVEGDASSGATADRQQQQRGSSSAANVWNIGSTYHDEDNLAALLIDHDRKTGQLQVDGTIGNDFVIKPMPQATIEALLFKRQQELLKRQQREQAPTTEQLSSAPAQTSPRRLDRQQTAANGNNAAAKEAASVASQQTSANSSSENGSSASASSEAATAALHLHDDDPHDDDEMFLDEDEAIELAHLRHVEPSPAAASATKSSGASPGESQTSPDRRLNSSHQLPQQPRALSKAASERKWRKYRKLMAQTQVPKPGALAQQQQRDDNLQSATRTSPSSSSSSAATVSGSPRGRRQASQQQQELPKAVQVSHHIVYRQKPSSEGSSSEHRRSFMFAPGEQQLSADSMERMAASFAPQRLTKRSLNSAAKSKLSSHEHNEEADFEEDPLDGQFFLEPGSITGFERAGHSDWSLVSSANSTATSEASNEALNNKHRSLHPRFRRQAPGSGASRVAGSNGKPLGAKRIVPGQAAQSQVRRKRQAPDTVWPEVLLVVDYDSFLLHGGDSRDVKRYFVSFWNGVDLRYKLLVHPHIRISLAGMIVAKDRDATPYLERNRLRAPNADAVDAAGALTDMGKYLYREDRLPTYDLAVVITKLDMCRRRYEGGRCNRGTAGFAYVGGACVVNKRLEKVNSVAIIEDSGGFSGIIVAAHEVGHLLGCVHDGSPPPSYLGGPGATHCPWEDGFIMSDLRHTERGFRWSQCSVEQFKHFLNGETATCLYNYPHESQMLHRLLPGTMLSLDEQCKRDRGTNACFKDARVCAQLFCFDSASGYCVSYRPAAEGSPCGEGQVCRNGKCVGEIENIIPDYTHQSQTVVAGRRPAASAATTSGSHSVARLADNGLSASSTSTATSSPDSKLMPPSSSSIVAASAATVVASGLPLPASTAGSIGIAQQQQQLSNRMDTFAIDSPMVPSAIHPKTTFGGRYSSASNNGAALALDGSSTGLVLMRQQAPNSVLAPATNNIQLATSTNLPNVPKCAGDGYGTATIPATTINNNHNHSNNRQQPQPQVHGFLQRTGLQVIPKGANQTPVKQYFTNNNNPIGHSTPSASLYASASTSLLHQQYPSSSNSGGGMINGNNLLTSTSSNPITMANKQQQLYDNQRIMYKPNNHPQQQHHHQDGQFSSNTNYVNRINLNVQ